MKRNTFTHSGFIFYLVSCFIQSVFHVCTNCMKNGKFRINQMILCSLSYTSQICELFTQNAPSDMVDRVLNNPFARSSHRTCSMKKGVLENFTKFARKHLCQSLFFNKVAGLRPEAQVFSCEFCKIFKNTFFTEHIWTTASVWLLNKLHTHNPDVLGRGGFRITVKHLR